MRFKFKSRDCYTLIDSAKNEIEPRCSADETSNGGRFKSVLPKWGAGFLKSMRNSKSTKQVNSFQNKNSHRITANPKPAQAPPLSSDIRRDSAFSDSSKISVSALCLEIQSATEYLLEISSPKAFEWFNDQSTDDEQLKALSNMGAKRYVDNCRAKKIHTDPFLLDGYIRFLLLKFSDGPLIPKALMPDIMESLEHLEFPVTCSPYEHNDGLVLYISVELALYDCSMVLRNLDPDSLHILRVLGRLFLHIMNECVGQSIKPSGLANLFPVHGSALKRAEPRSKVNFFKTLCENNYRKGLELIRIQESPGSLKSRLMTKHDWNCVVGVILNHSDAIFANIEVVNRIRQKKAAPSN